MTLHYSAARDMYYERRSNEERFWEKVDRSGECWLWTACVQRGGYGCFYARRDGQKRLVKIGAHRFALELATGHSLPDGLEVCHRCDTPLCVNPAHLFLGTRLDNARDAVSKDRVHNKRRLWTTCMRGHPLTPENTVIRTNGARRCKTCKRRVDGAARRARAARRAASSH